MKLKILHLRNKDYSKVPLEILASALVKLEDTNILRARLSPNQVECLFNKMVNSEIMNILHRGCQMGPVDMNIYILKLVLDNVRY